MASSPNEVANNLPGSDTGITQIPVQVPAPVQDPTQQHPAVVTVEASKQAAFDAEQAALQARCNSFCLPLFTKVCGQQKAVIALHDADDALAVLLKAGEKTITWAQSAIKIANENVSNIIFWLQAAKQIFQGDPQMQQDLDTAIGLVQDFSLLVKGGQSVQAAVATIQMPTSAADLGTTATAVQAAVVTAEAVIESLQANGVKTNIDASKLNDVNTTISKVVAAANTFSALQQAQQRVGASLTTI